MTGGGSSSLEYISLEEDNVSPGELRKIFKESEEIARRAFARMGEAYFKPKPSFLDRLYQKYFC